MLLRKMVAAKKYPNLDVSLITRGVDVNSLGKSFLVARITAVNKIPNITDVQTVTTIENFAAFEFPAPSSLDTRTLQEKYEYDQGRRDNSWKFRTLGECQGIEGTKLASNFVISLYVHLPLLFLLQI